MCQSFLRIFCGFPLRIKICPSYFGNLYNVAYIIRKRLAQSFSFALSEEKQLSILRAGREYGSIYDIQFGNDCSADKSTYTTLSLSLISYNIITILWGYPQLVKSQKVQCIYLIACYYTN